MTTHDTPWAASAACATRLDLPWLSDHADTTPWDAEAMRGVCAACPVVLDCLAAVHALDITGGWWAGADRDPHAHTADTAPAWATHTPDQPVAGTAWEPITTRRGRVVGAQGAMPLLGRAA
ncbi:WhiB family transcriptional regulator [Arsenicicoccus dermatophilus]|uniref:WhiB family transcriptional regulator n=1 Tax=Arsenicicoccus dermatophilus TaxID=1076331 RepID=UPI001F4D26D0|nr:WhiB family transcriptional regulator [Arsenicicoccus dermatophilus]MCH8611900.1 WhiB family transcriptional regulator [Arsenicicoccus dermatophilus]